MTIALGILAQDGIVVAADTEESTGGYLKGETTKILQVFGDGPACLISGAGDSGYVESLMSELAEVFFIDKMRVHQPLQQAFEDCMKNFYSEHIIPFAAYSSQDRPVVEMLIAYNRNNQRGLLVSEKSVVFQKMPYAAVGCGSIFADILLNRLWQMADIKAVQVLAAYVLFMVKECVEGCGKLTQISALHGSRVVTEGASSRLVPAPEAVTSMHWDEINELEKKFRTSWARAECDALWNLIAEEIK
jgi:20S proteasome alpha/beta subunit